MRLAVLGSSTLTHLLPAIRVAGLRRGIWVDAYEMDYGQYLKERRDPESDLRGGFGRIGENLPSGSELLPPHVTQH